MFIDIHTHQCNSSGAAIYNISPGEDPCEGLFSAGIHPWQAGRFSAGYAVSLLETMKSHANFVAVGEVGIDRACNVPLTQQIPLFGTQLQWAAANGVPCIIHCVRAYSDILQVLKHQRTLPQLIFHAYTGNAQITEALIRCGAYFSFGARELSRQSGFLPIPVEHIFLETDTQSSDIREVYSLAGTRWRMDVEEIADVIARNAKCVWPQCRDFYP